MHTLAAPAATKQRKAPCTPERNKSPAAAAPYTPNSRPKVRAKIVKSPKKAKEKKPPKVYPPRENLFRAHGRTSFKMIEDAIKAGALKGFDDKAGFLSMVDKQKAKVDKQTEEAAEDTTQEIIWNEKVASMQKQVDENAAAWQMELNMRCSSSGCWLDGAWDALLKKKMEHREAEERSLMIDCNNEAMWLRQDEAREALEDKVSMLELKLKAAREEKNAANRKLRGAEGCVFVCADCGK